MPCRNTATARRLAAPEREDRHGNHDDSLHSDEGGSRIVRYQGHSVTASIKNRRKEPGVLPAGAFPAANIRLESRDWTIELCHENESQVRRSPLGVWHKIALCRYSARAGQLSVEADPARGDNRGRWRPGPGRADRRRPAFGVDASADHH